MDHYFPRFDEFTQLAQQHTVVPVYRQLTSDTLTPVSAFLKIQDGEWSFLFESVVGGERVGRYSFLSSSPFKRIQANGKHVQIVQPNQPTVTLEVTDPIKFLETEISKYRAPKLPGIPYFFSGAVGYAGYDTVRYVEHLPNPPKDDRQLPDMCFGFHDEMVIFHHINKTIQVVALAHLADKSPEEAYQQACARVDALVEKLRKPIHELPLVDIAPKGSTNTPFASNCTRESFHRMVNQAKEYINAGDIFQIVLSQRLQAKTKAKPFDIYRSLRILNPSPFMFFIQAEGYALVGSSPEIMVRVDEGEITVRPLAGTRRRGANSEEDRRLAEELLADPKERAEHIMLVDLGRNDVGRVSQFGSVQLSDLMTVEYYSHVMHISSTVTGMLKPEYSCLDALQACLPAGTLSGAPKIRAMEIIDELEPHRRGPYGGAVGYVDFTGNMDTCIALRTMVIQGDMAYVQAGAGLVADSDPEMEYMETMNKAMGLLRALEVAENYLSSD